MITPLPTHNKLYTSLMFLTLAYRMLKDVKSENENEKIKGILKQLSEVDYLNNSLFAGINIIYADFIDKTSSR